MVKFIIILVLWACLKVSAGKIEDYIPLNVLSAGVSVGTYCLLDRFYSRDNDILKLQISTITGFCLPLLYWSRDPGDYISTAGGTVFGLSFMLSFQ